MAKSKTSASGKGRKAGDWVAIARGRENAGRVVVNGHGISNVPGRGEVGSAAYRRLITGRTRKAQVA